MHVLSTGYYTDLPIDGIPLQYGYKQAPKTISSGETFVKEYEVNFLDRPLNFNDWKIEVYVKRNVYASSILWRGVFEAGWWKKGNNILVIIPDTVTTNLCPDTYVLDIVGIQNVANEYPKPIVTILASDSFSIKLTAGLSEGILSGTFDDEVVVSKENLNTTTTQGIENTMPKSEDISGASGIPEQNTVWTFSATNSST